MLSHGAVEYRSGAVFYMMRIINKTGGRVAAEKAESARSFVSRLVGLIGRESLDPSNALVIPECRHVHTFFMRFPIDIVFLNGENVVVRVAEGVKPWRFSVFCRDAVAVVEMAAGAAAGIRVGDVLSLEEADQ